MKEQIFLMGGNPPIKKYSIVDKIVLSTKIKRIIIFTVFRENWEPYMKKYTEVFQSQFPNLNIDYLLLDTEQIDLDSYLDADIIIIGGGNTEKYIATYVNQEFKSYIDHMLNKEAKIIGFSAGALLLGEKVYVSPNDNSDHQIKIKNGLGLFSQFLISVHYDSWDDKANKDRAEELVNVPIIPLNDHSCLVLDKLGNIIEKID
ncbi:TPA: Type 1 glutamine amidotransferase-like domain-containing protein [Streptococcus pneumoniae]|uniref:Type 1 glutamine amidotransferase-like domain-containing protein n=5 Tax=Streptococcus pneumoniae TaxID=1313 RepID=A0AAP5J6W5_STREE|nr:Type 1 glutamine amidotransferase-like domain-containing protein [Streptococcus pneumoniae]KXW03513.1 peptidase S51 [Streptococcus pneumoniae]MDD0471266.1 Type 1 glutamine amidotransferase-like domain-containing protein [Streptococcus pneumoniae]MDS2262405.1 Type 1 glutamine amidotransferase-like domain-containing protein [Streptococcus pneumoniae]MDS2264166.1 Type 1 glutamine amidotransferase-like domain-containing protein [Streptococcus pneumoniae]MDS2407900.1 Type 1 glutamine amidotransf